MRATLASLLAALPRSPERFRALAAGVEDWDALLEAAAVHGVDGVLVHHLEALAVPWPSRVRETWRDRHAFEQIAQRRIGRVLDEALGALGREGVTVCPLKGPLLAARLYPAGALRRSSDVDLLVARSDRARALRALGSIGYRTGSSARLAHELAHEHQILLERPHDPPIELHIRALVGFGAELPSEPLLASASPQPRDGAPTCVRLAPEDEVLYLLLHAAGHLFERLGWLYDVKRLVETTDGLDVATLKSRARAHRLERALGFAARWLADELGVPLRLSVARGLTASAAEAWARWAQRRPRTGAERTVSWLAYHASLAEDGNAAARYVAHHVARIGMRRAHRWAPDRVPASWAG
ncbi:MAG: hypothetical protein OHK0013_23450 [Sandaracinaceae bacterium]